MRRILRTLFGSFLSTGSASTIGAARGAQGTGERAVDVVRRARLGGAGAVRVARDEARDNCLERVGFGGGEGFERLQPLYLWLWRGGGSRLPQPTERQT